MLSECSVMALRKSGYKVPKKKKKNIYMLLIAVVFVWQIAVV